MALTAATAVRIRTAHDIAAGADVANVALAHTSSAIAYTIPVAVARTNLVCASNTAPARGAVARALNTGALQNTVAIVDANLSAAVFAREAGIAHTGMGLTLAMA